MVTVLLWLLTLLTSGGFAPMTGTDLRFKIF